MDKRLLTRIFLGIVVLIGLLMVVGVVVTHFPDRNQTTDISGNILVRHDVGERDSTSLGITIPYKVLELSDRLITTLDTSVPFFPSVIRTWWWQKSAVQFLVLVPLVLLLAVICAIRPKIGGLLSLLFVLWIVPIPYIISARWDNYVVAHNFNYAFPWSSEYVWIGGEKAAAGQNTKYEYSWRQNHQPAPTKIKVSCLGHYRLAVNGQRIYHGPSFGVLPTVYYDELEITDQIKVGDNTLTIICNHIDSYTHEYQTYPAPGLLVGGVIPDGISGHTIADARLWKYGVMNSLQPIERLFDAGYREAYDLTQSDTLEKTPLELKLEYSVKPRPLPLLQYAPHEVKHISQGVYDLGKFSTGYLGLQTHQAEECEVELVWGAMLDAKGLPIKYMNQVDTLKLPIGDTQWEQFSRRAGRYISLSGDCDPQNLTISFTRVFNDFVQPSPPADMSEVDQAIFALSLNSLQVNVQDHFEDSVDREKAMYMGDAVAISQCLLSTPGNEAQVKQAVAQFAQGQNQNGSFPSMVPSGREQFIPSYTLQWPSLLDMYLTSVSDPAFAEEMWPHLTKLMAWAETQETTEGIFFNKFRDQKWWDFVDWTKVDLGLPYHTPNQLWYIRALEITAQRAEELGEDPTPYRQKAVALKQLLMQRAYNSQLHVFYDSFGEELQGTTGISLVTNALAGSLGMFPDQASSQAAIRYFKDKYFTESPFSQSWVISWFIAADQPDLALSVMRGYWGGMVKEGATSVYEVYKPGSLRPDPRSQSYSHAWGCGPVVFYNQILSTAK